MKNKKDKIIVIAGNNGQFRNWLSDLSPRDDNDFICADYASKIAGVKAQAVIEIGTSYERNDYDEVKRLALSRIL